MFDTREKLAKLEKVEQRFEEIEAQLVAAIEEYRQVYAAEHAAAAASA